MNIITTAVTTRKTTVELNRSEIERILLEEIHAKGIYKALDDDNVSFVWAGNGNGGVSIDFVDEDVVTPLPPTSAPATADNGIDWSTAPTWANWAGWSPEMGWCWYEVQPLPHVRGNYWTEYSRDGSISFFKAPAFVGDWECSLQQRPAAPAVRPDNDVEKQSDDGWIVWTATEDSRDPPVDGHVRVNVLLSSGSVPGVGIEARAFRWYTVPGMPHIVSYKLYS